MVYFLLGGNVGTTVVVTGMQHKITTYRWLINYSKTWNPNIWNSR